MALLINYYEVTFCFLYITGNIIKVTFQFAYLMANKMNIHYSKNNGSL